MTTKGKIVKESGKVIGKEVAEKTGKAVYKRRGTLAVVFGALAATAVGYWATKVRGKKK
ncbi:hypothetical protein [Planktosalinus lacus]|uniref:Uncharacterized protein n=1 Tax=Planktosalinus lacus TaxID=1526573 RepID=A0A8J2VAZ8_9FLAO|nr:hypothetical protein [Planktosalinus lacus]GGD99506.1 hypothetical protein GCM10011312_23690 [Planktosalinus lacus]